MEKDLYKIMQEIKEKSLNTVDVEYIGSITIDKETEYGTVKIGKDIFALIDRTPDNSIVIKYYDENRHFLGGKNEDGELFPSIEYSNNDIGFLHEIDDLNKNQAISLNDVDQKLDEVSRFLGIDKSAILSMSETELDQAIKSKDSDKISLSDNKEDLGINPKQQEDQNKDVIDNINSKQEIDLNKKIDDRHSLAQVLGVEPGSKLIAVHSDSIEDNENSTRFSCIIKNPDGSLSKPESLKQVGGKYSDKRVYETNRDGSNVSQKNIQSSFAIDSSIVKDGLITVRYGQMGNLEIGYGQTDKTSHRDAFTQRLETRETYPVTAKVREEFSQKKGEYNISEKIDEIEEHKKHGCSNLTLEEADGNLHTGHTHSDDAAELILSDDNVGKKIDDAFTFEEVKERFELLKSKNPDMDFDTLVEVTKEDLAEDASRMHEIPGHRH